MACCSWHAQPQKDQLCKTMQLYVPWQHPGSLKLTAVEVLLPQELVNGINQVFFPLQSWLVSLYQPTFKHNISMDTWPFCEDNITAQNSVVEVISTLIHEYLSKIALITALKGNKYLFLFIWKTGDEHKSGLPLRNQIITGFGIYFNKKKCFEVMEFTRGVVRAVQNCHKDRGPYLLKRKELHSTLQRKASTNSPLYRKCQEIMAVEMHFAGLILFAFSYFSRF